MFAPIIQHKLSALHSTIGGGLVVFGALSLFLAFVYWALIEYYRKQWKSLPYCVLDKNFVPSTSITILIPARNESQNIINCLTGISQQKYPKELLQVIVLDDFSTDDTAEKAIQFAINQPFVQVLRLSDCPPNTSSNYSPKKTAIETGISRAQGELIVCTDADCVAETTYWLLSLAEVYEREKPVFIAAPVVFAPATTLLQRFQQLDFMGMMAITGAGIHSQQFYMCNGANLAYPKAIFEQVNGFEGNKQFASGDDVFLLQKIARLYPQRIAFIKNTDANVITAPAPHLRNFIKQRLRWATKSRGYHLNPMMQTMLLCVGLFHLDLLFSLLFVFWAGYWALLIFALQWLIKTVADYRLLSVATHFFRQPQALRIFPIALFMHWFYIVGIGLAANFVKKYSWKNRRLS